MEARETVETFAINGYGVPENVMTDGNYERYLSACAKQIFDITERPNLIFCGGPTHPRRNVSEAEVMIRWFFERRRQQMANAKVWRVEGMDLRENIVGLSDLFVGNTVCFQGEVTRFAYFVEYCRQDFPTYLVGRTFPHGAVIPVHFDLRPWPRLNRLRHAASLPLRIAATHSKFVRDHIERPLRMRKIAAQK